MKILVLSLLRLGDVIQQQPLIAGLRRKFPHAQIEMLVNRSAIGAAEVVSGVDDWIIFEREQFQQKIGIAEIPLMAPVQELSEFIQGLSAQNYDVVFNFTHNRLSAYLAESIDATVKYGLVAEGQGFRAFDNAWLRHLNQRTTGANTTPFQLTELLAGAFGLDIKPVVAEAKGNFIFLQPLTSDSKKNWALSNWAKLLENLRNRFPQYTVCVLGAPFEAGELSRHFSPDDLFLGSLAQVRDLFESAALLITGDTSIKHLAANSGVPILEIALGSSNPARTGAYQDGALILQSKVACAPCAHSGRCRMMSHVCGEALMESIVEDAAGFLLEGSVLPAVQTPVVLETAKVIGREWVKGATESDRLLNFLDRSVWRAFLNETAVDENFSEVVKEIKASAAQAETLQISVSELQGLQQTAGICAQQLEETAGVAMQNGFAAETLNAFRQKLASQNISSGRHAAHLLDFVEIGQMPYAHPLAFFGAAQKASADLDRRLQITQNILNSITPSGGPHVGKSGNASDRSPEAS